MLSDTLEFCQVPLSTILVQTHDDRQATPTFDHTVFSPHPFVLLSFPANERPAANNFCSFYFFGCSFALSSFFLIFMHLFFSNRACRVLCTSQQHVADKLEAFAVRRVSCCLPSAQRHCVSRCLNDHDTLFSETSVCDGRVAECNTAQRSATQRSALERHMYTTCTRKLSSPKSRRFHPSCASGMFLPFLCGNRSPGGFFVSPLWFVATVARLGSAWTV